MTQLLDHLLVAVITVLFPLYSWYQLRRVQRRLALPGAAPINTVQEYQVTITALAVLAALCLANWLFQGRDVGTLGLGAGATPLRWAAGAVLALVLLGLTWREARKVRRDPDARAAIRDQVDGLGLAFLLPHTSREARWFRGVAFTAGLCEEILYRGFLIWYLAQWLGVVPALLASSVVFGVAHAYQGVANIPRVAVIALWLGGIFLVTGSLWLAMATHFVYDAIVGEMVHVSLRERRSAATC